jgi:adenosylmethionine-8-amino-7-oxononanoate aminotransferase
VEVALKMAMQYWSNSGARKPAVIALEGAYHGDTFGAMSVGERGIFTRPFNDFLFDVFFLPFPSDENVVTVFENRVRMGDVGIFIYEPLVQGASGMRMYSSNVLDKLLRVAKAHDVLCIADEVFTGFCRTGKWFASDYLSVSPDLVCLSKGLTGGTLPLGVTSCSKEVEAAFLGRTGDNIFFHGHSFTANPLTCAVANASFQLLVDPVCQSSIRRISERHAGFARRLHGHPLLRDTRFTGTILALEIHHGMTEYNNELRNRIYTFFLDRNILLRPLGNILYVLPPYCTTDAELDMIYAAMEDFLKSLK